MNIEQKELSFIDDRYFKRGKQIVKEGATILDKINPDRIEAYEVGTSIYQVNLLRAANAHNFLYTFCQLGSHSLLF
jgi:hypothetical protein